MSRRNSWRATAFVVAATALLAIAVVPALARDGSQRQAAQAQLLPKSKLTVKSIIQADLVTDTARLPLYRATVKGQPVWYTQRSPTRASRVRAA